MRNKILEYMKTVDKARLKDIYSLEEISKSKDSLRGIINILTKEGLLIRLERGVYSIKK